jgi:hypothetical protein
MAGTVAVSALAFLLSACGGGSRSDDHPTHTPTAIRTDPLHMTDLRNRALEELTPSEHIVVRGEAGAGSGLPETQIHTPDAKAYVFEAACAGSGSPDLKVVTVKVHSGPIHHVSCDGDMLSYPFQGRNLVSVQLDPANASGLLVWQVIPQPQ